MVKKRIKFGDDLHYGKYDTELLKKAREILQNVHGANYDASRKTKLLETVINKLDRILEEFGEKRTQL